MLFVGLDHGGSSEVERPHHLFGREALCEYLHSAPIRQFRNDDGVVYLAFPDQFFVSLQALAPVGDCLDTDRHAVFGRCRAVHVVS